MNELDLDKVFVYVNENIVDFHRRRIRTLEGMGLNVLLRKNPYLFKAKHILTAGDLVVGLMDAFLSSSEEKLFGDFLEGLAIYIAEQTCGGHKSAAQGVDLELILDGTHYLISVKSGPNWGNSSQHKKIAEDLRDAETRVKQSQRGVRVQTVLGICYGKTKTRYVSGYLKVVGQNFWTLIGGNRNLYVDIIEPIGYRAKEHNEAFNERRAALANQLTKQFIDRFCDADGAIDWTRVVEFNSKNYDLDKL